MHVWRVAWDGDQVWDFKGVRNGGVLDFQLPAVPDLRKLQFKFNSTVLSTGQVQWEADDFIRRLYLSSPQEIWTFESSARILYTDPFPAGVSFNTGALLTVHVLTQNRFRGGKLYVWNPYDSSKPVAFFNETARDDAQGLSTFNINLLSWMTNGFHLKLMCPGNGGQPDVWEPDASNRVWRPCDGNSIWLKSGQVDVRSQPLTISSFAIESLFPASQANPPNLSLRDEVEKADFPLAATSVTNYTGSPLFKVARYTAQIYAGASYSIATTNNLENPAISRPFPADPTNTALVSRFVVGASAWIPTFPAIVASTLSIQPHGQSSFGKGVAVQSSLGNGPAYETAAASLQPDGTWLAKVNLAQNTTTSIRLLPSAGTEPKPYDWIDTGRYFTPKPGATAFFTTEGMYGICARGKTPFADPAGRGALMQAAFGGALVQANVFGPKELPHGATPVGTDVFFVVHAPHAIQASLILVDETAPGGPTRHGVPMSLTNDTLYWWCKVPATNAPSGTRYHFLLNDDLEVMDPAARGVQDRGTFDTAFGDDPADPGTSWSVVVDTADVFAEAHVQLWQTMGWQNLLIYELHAKRFTDLQPGPFAPLELLADELNSPCRRGQPGYLRQLPVTVLGLMPVSEFSSTLSWGYNPSFYFAVDSFYGGAKALARFVNTAHANGRGVMLDLVYNHSLGSPLMKVAADVYRNGDYYGDRMNCGHPMVGEFLRQASVYLWRTFGLDGFRFDDTKTIVGQCQGGWQFLGNIRAALRSAANAEGKAWPYCVAENSVSAWDISNPAWGVMDGQWDIDEVFRLRDASYDSWHDGWDDAGRLANEMNQPQYWGRPFFQATRFGESHDMVSEQDPGNKRIAARPPFGQGFRMAKALGTLTLLSNGVPMLFMGQEVGETVAFSFDTGGLAVNPQLKDLPPGSATAQTRILSWFRSLMGLRNDPAKGLQGDANYQVVGTGYRTVAFTCGSNQRLFVVVTFGTSNQQQNSAWLGLPAGISFKEIFNSSWPAFAVESEIEQANGGYAAQIYAGNILNLPAIGAVVLERT